MHMVSTSSNYIRRQPERLVVEGYRQLALGMVTKDAHHWKAAQGLYISLLGQENGNILMRALANFINVLQTCSTCPLKTRSAQPESLSRNEILILGLLSGIQYGDQQMVILCLDELSCPVRCAEVEAAAGELALLMRGLNQMLLPLPHNALREATLEPLHRTSSVLQTNQARPSRTLH